MDNEETFKKKQTIEKAIDIVGSKNALMIGDSKYDYQGVKEVKIDFVDVLYGFGFKENNIYPFETIKKPT